MGDLKRFYSLREIGFGYRPAASIAIAVYPVVPCLRKRCTGKRNLVEICLGIHPRGRDPSLGVLYIQHAPKHTQALLGRRISHVVMDAVVLGRPLSRCSIRKETRHDVQDLPSGRIGQPIISKSFIRLKVLPRLEPPAAIDTPDRCAIRSEE